ncbi:MAG: DUF6090 family protein [Ignavibacteriaceae bacterium]
MVKIFRNIRQKLAAENKVMAYLRYAIGEILLVVIGILIALQVNNWNELRKQNIAETEFMVGVKKDLTQDKNYIEFILKKSKSKIEAYDLLSKIDFQKNHSENKNFVDSLFQIYLSTEGARTFYPVSGSFQSALSGNMLNNYKNKEITSSLIKLYNSTYSRLMDDNNILNDRWDYLRKKYIHEYRTGNFLIKDNKMFSEIMDDLYYHYLMLKWYRGVLKDTLIEIDGILKKINDKLH